MSRLVALDTETTGLDPDTEDVFDLAIIDLSTGRECEWHFLPRPEVVTAMHPRALAVNHYYERVAETGWWWNFPNSLDREVLELLDGAHIVGAVPDFDTRHLTSLYKRHGLTPPRWHYHLIDVEAMAVGWLHGRSAQAADHFRASNPLLTATRPDTELPWRSDDLSRACGVEPPSEDERHTALGDARWVARWYRALTGGAA